jgi:hypothetical protein
MDFSWLQPVFDWLVAANQVVNNFVSLFGFVTVVGAATGFLIRWLFKDPFGPPVPVGPRYRKFYESLALRLSKRNKYLTPPDDVKGTPLCTFGTVMTDGAGMTYCVHFQANKTFCVYLKLAGAGAPDKFQALRQAIGAPNPKSKTYNSLGLVHRRFFKPAMVDDLKFETPESGGGYRIAVYYDGGGVIKEDAKKLKDMRKWAIRRLDAFQQTFDKPIPAAQAEVSAAHMAPAPSVAS